MPLLSVQEAASELGVDPSRIRALISAGDLPAVRIGRRWAIESAEIARRLQDAGSPGRPLKPENAWGVLFLASGQPAPWLSSGARWRADQSLAFRGLAELRPRLRRRAGVDRFRAHPGELDHLRANHDVIKSGISATGRYRLGLAAGREVDGYVRADRLDRLRRKHALEPADVGSANVVLRAVPDPAWHLDGDEDDDDDVAPLAAVAVDLAEDPDSRSSRIGRELIKKLDRERRGHG